MKYKKARQGLLMLLGHYISTTDEIDLTEQSTSVNMGIQALKVVDTLYTLIEQGKVTSVSTEQLNQVLDEFMKGGDEK